MSRLHQAKVTGSLPMSRKEKARREEAARQAATLAARASVEGVPPEVLAIRDRLDTAGPGRAPASPAEGVVDGASKAMAGVIVDTVRHERAAGCFWARLARANQEGAVPPAKCALSKRYGQTCLMEAGLDCDDYRVGVE